MKLVKEYLAEIHEELLYEFLNGREIESNEHELFLGDDEHSDSESNLFCINSFAVDDETEENADFVNTEVLFYSENEDSIKVKVRQTTKYNEYNTGWEWHDIEKH